MHMPETVLVVVDDEPIVSDVVHRYLVREGYETLEAGDGDAARERHDARRRISSCST